MKKIFLIGAIAIVAIVILFLSFYIFNQVGIGTETTIDRLKAEVQKNPYSVELHYKLAEKYMEHGDIDNYEKQILLLKKMAPHSYLYPAKLGDHYFSLGQYEVALKYYQEAIELIKDQDALLFFKIGNCYTNLDDKENAIKYYKLQLDVLKKNKSQNEKMKKFIEDLVHKLGDGGV